MDAGYFDFEIWDDIIIIKRASIQETAGGSYLSVISQKAGSGGLEPPLSTLNSDYLTIYFNAI